MFVLVVGCVWRISTVFTVVVWRVEVVGVCSVWSIDVNGKAHEEGWLEMKVKGEMMLHEEGQSLFQLCFLLLFFSI